MNKKILTGLLTFAALNSVSSVQAFNNGDIINFKAGERQCAYGGVVPNCNFDIVNVVGSYFAMDTNGNGVFEQAERSPMSVGSDGGIVLGAIQASPDSHGGCPDGTETSPIDAPWCFFGSTGMHQTIATPVTDNGDGTLNFTGWGVTWNGIPNIPLGGDPVNFADDTGAATVTCANVPCNIGDSYFIDYLAHVPIGDPSNFGGVPYKLHLESDTPDVPVATIFINVAGGNMQECTAEGGSSVQMSASTTVPDGDAISVVEWSVDGVNVASGTDVSVFIALGAHQVSASLTTVNGLVATKSVPVNIQDTISPTVTAAFIDKYTGSVLTEVVNDSRVVIQAEASDICDSSPVVTANIGAPVVDGQKIKVIQHHGNVKLSTSSLDLTVSAVDASGNGTVASASLVITE